MISDEYTALLDAFLDGELSGDAAERVRAHLDTCAACRGYWEDLLAIRAAFPAVEETEVPEGFAEAVLAALPPRRTVTIWVDFCKKAALPVAAALAVVLIAGGVGLRRNDTDSTVGMERAAVMDADTGGAEMPMEAALYAMDEAAEEETVNDTEEAATGTRDMDAGAPVPEPSGKAAETYNAAVPEAAARAVPSAVPDKTPEEAEEAAPEYAHTLLTLPPEAAPLLSDRTPYQTTERGDWYALPDEEAFRALLKTLSAAGIQPSTEPVEALVNPPEAPYLVFVEK